MKKKLFISAALMALAVGGLAGCSKGGGLNPSGSSSNPSSSTNPSQIDYQKTNYNTFHSLAVNADKYNPGYSVAEITLVIYYNGDLDQQYEGTYVYSNGEWTYSYGDNVVSSSFFETKASSVTEDEGAEFYYSETKGFYLYETFTEIQDGIEVYVEGEVAFDSYGYVCYVAEKQSANYQGQDIEMISVLEVVYS